MIYSGNVKDLFLAQLKEWDLARVNYKLLSDVKIKEFRFNNFTVLVQFNPERIKSSSASVDKRSLDLRPCFLCGKNRPLQQKELKVAGNLVILVNPFPIFPQHITVPSIEHSDQRIKNNFNLMLDLAESLPDFVIFYNGPQCGASAPDHFHFQAGNRGFLPLEADYEEKKHVTRLSSRKLVEFWHWQDYLRGMMTLVGRNREDLLHIFDSFYEEFLKIQPDKPEPMLNILAYYENRNWIVHIIPRRVHRPEQFFAEGENRIMISPASVDLGGVIITPREADFKNITADTIEDIFRQVCLTDEEVIGLFEHII
jgi:ATP adenylyltransferase/5',5'''-P-1,P-4-tetraphosphate phosphorylase II